MDALDSIMSDMNKERPKGVMKPKSTTPARQQSSTRTPQNNQAALPTKREQKFVPGESTMSRPSPNMSRPSPNIARPSPNMSRPPTVFNKRPLSDNHRTESVPEAKREKIMETFRTIRGTDIQTNQFEVFLDGVPDSVERFHVDIFLTTVSKKTIQVNGETKVHGDLAKQYCRWALWNVMKLAIQKNQQLFNKPVELCDTVYDCGASLYFRNRVYKSDNENETTLSLWKAEFEAPIWSPIAKLSRSDIEQITVVIVRNKGSGQIYTRGENFLKPENRNELIRFLEVLTSQTTNSRHFFQFGNCTFNRSSDEKNGKIDTACQLDEDGKEIKSGFEKTMRMVSTKDGQPKIVMSIDVRRSPFYQEQPVLTFLKVIYNAARGSNGGGGDRGGHGGFGRGGRGNDFGGDRRGNGYQRDGRRESFGGRSGRFDDGGRDGYKFSQRRRDSQGGYSRDYDRKPLHGKDPIITEIMETILRDGKDKTNKKLNELKSLAVVPQYLSSEKMNQFFIHDFEYRSAHEIMFEYKKDETLTEISLFKYFQEKYNITLKYPEMPLAIKKNGKGSSYYPLEVLIIERGQRVKQNNITAKIQKEMTGKLAMLPLHQIEQSQDILHNYLNVHENEFLRSFGVRIDGEPTKLTAKILPGPIIHFAKNASTQPITGTGKRPNIDSSKMIFSRPATLNEIWIINFDEAIYRNIFGKLCDALYQACRTQSIGISKHPNDWRVIDCYESDHETLEKIMKDAKRLDISLLFAITKEQRPDVHDVLKLFESQIGVQTQHISLKTANMLMAPNGKQTTDNVIRKLNLKCGGLNFAISVPRAENSRIICENDRRVQQMFFDNTLLIGFELAHAGATCLFDRQNNIACGEPSVVGYSYSCGNPCDLGGNSYLQKPREHSLMYLPKHMTTMLSNYLSVKETLPKKVVIYRSGVGEGDFEKVAREVEQMKSVFEKGGKFEGEPTPQFLMVVVSKTSHMRIYPQHVEPGKAFQQNVPSGTCVATEITSYGRDEFYLISQMALIGTIRPARYTIIVNDPKWSLNEVSHLSYFLAFGHQVSYGPPAVPNILYAAENMAKRGRANFKTHQKLERVNGAIGDRSQGREDDDVGTMMDALSSQLNRCAITGKNFWA